MNLKIVDNWKESWKWISSLCMALSMAVLQFWDMVPADMKSILQGTSTGQIVFWLMVIGFVGRYIDQTPKQPPEQP